MRTLFAEVRHAVRVLARNRTTTLVSFVTVALAIGATTTIFTVGDGLLLRRLPYPDPNGLVHIGRQFADEVGESTSIPQFVALAALEGGAFEAIAAYERLGGGFNLVGSGPPDRIVGCLLYTSPSPRDS